MKIPFASRVERLQTMLADLRYWEDDAEVRVRLVDLLQHRIRIDPEAAKAAGITVNNNVTTVLGEGPFHDEAFRSVVEAAPCPA